MATLTDKLKRNATLEEIEKIEAMGDESESKGRKAVTQVYKDELLQKEKEKADILTLMDMRKGKNDYNTLVAKILSKKIQDEDLPVEVEWEIKPDVKGVVLRMLYKGMLFQSAFFCIRKPVYDYNACERFAIKMSNQVARIDNAGHNLRV